MSQSPIKAQPPDWDQHRDAGKSAAQANHWPEARASYLAAWRIKQTWQLAANLGRAELQLGAFRDAAEHLTYAMREAPPNLAQEAPAEWGALRDMLQKARAKVGALAITVEPPGAEVRIAGLAVGRAPLSGMVFVEPGAVVVEASAPGYVVGRTSVLAVADREDAVKLVLTIPARPAEHPSSMSGKRVAGFVTAGAGGFALGVGAVTGIMAVAKHHDGWASCNFALTRCTPSGYDAANAGKKLTTASTVAFALGAAGAGAGAYLLWTTWPRGRRIGLTLSPGSAGMLVEGDF